MRHPVLKRVVRFLGGLALLPFCVSITMAVASLVGSIRPASYSLVPWHAWALPAGFVLWVSLYLAFPRPIRAYVLAHELTHALWGYLSGLRILKMKVSDRGGSVVLTGNNILVTLAPYFFPLYTVLVVIAFYGVSIFTDASSWQLFWLALVGFTWGFHATFTVSTLMERQSDIHEYGRVLSYAVIYLFNVAGVGLWTVMVSSASLEQYVGLFAADTIKVWFGGWRLALRLLTR